MRHPLLELGNIITHIGLQKRSSSLSRRFNLTHIPGMPDSAEAYKYGANIVLGLNFE
jgi:hypothetical protein